MTPFADALDYLRQFTEAVNSIFTATGKILFPMEGNRK